MRGANELYLSPVSIWEARVPLREAPFTFAVAAAASRIELPQSDVGDIFLAAMAAAVDLTLVTSDSQPLGCSWLKTLPAG